MRPESLNEVVGQTSVKMVVKTLIKASNKNKTSVPHILFSGPAGCGKTSIARIISKEKNVNFFEINGCMINKVEDFTSIFKKVQENDVVFVDEIHSLNKKCSLIALNIMEDFSFNYMENNNIYKYRIPKFTFIGATTHLGLLTKPLQDRFKFVAEFVEYNESELVEIVHRVCKAYKFVLNDKVAKVISQTCRNTPRLVVSRTEWIRDFMIANDLKSLKVQDVLDIIKLQGFDENGLQLVDHRYLECLRKEESCSLNQLASKLSLDKDTVSETIEPYLLKKGYIKITKKGRMLV